MEAIFVLIPISLGIVFAALTVFIWAVNNYQFDDLEKEASRILVDDPSDIAGLTEQKIESESK